MKDVLEIKNVSKKFGKKTIIHDTSFTVREGEIYGLLGPNGAGKTTLIKMIMGLLKISDGNIKVVGYDVNKEYEKAAKNFKGIIENPEMYANLTGMQNLKMFTNLYKSVSKQELLDMADVVGLKSRINDQIKKYSLGMKQRLGIAQALVTNPKLLILDEPTNGLDPQGIKDLRNILRRLADNGTAVLVSSHLLAEMELMCDRVCILDKGKIIDVKDLHEAQVEKTDVNTGENILEYIMDTADNNYAYKIATDLNIEVSINKDKLNLVCKKSEVSKINKELVLQNVDVYEISLKTKSLEDMFLETTAKANEKSAENNNAARTGGRKHRG